jgi:hypothetical protein
MADLHHQLDQYLSDAGLGFARHDPLGHLLFETEQGLSMAACHEAQGRIRLFACPGHVAAPVLLSLPPSPAVNGDALAQLVLDTVARWTDAEAEWNLSVDRISGLVTLSLLLSDVPRQRAHWARQLQRFEAEFMHWRTRLQEKPPLWVRVGSAALPSGEASLSADFVRQRPH